MTVQNANDTGPLRIGDTFLDRYQILGVMGRGGFGYVYRARSQFMGREVAIKVMARQNKLTDELRARGQREAVILGQLEHPNIVRVYEAEVSPSGHLYIVMELLEGVTLGERIHERGPFGVREGLVILEKLCLALDSAHSIRAVHRDLKPANIFICNDGSPRVLDFGIAKLAGNAGWQTAPNMVVGTSLYISPEQIRGRPASHLSDIYALGLVAFQMFHGTHPLILREPNANLKDPQAIWQLQIKTQAPMLNQVVDGFPSHAARLVNTALAKDPGQRFQSARQMAEKVRIALLKLDADDGRSAAPQFSSDDTVSVQRSSDPAPPDDHRGASSAPAGTAQLNLRRTRKLFETIDSPPGSKTSGVEKKTPHDSRSTPSNDAVLAERTSGAVQNVSRTLSLPGLSRPLGSSRLWIGGVAIVLGVLAGVGLIAVTQPFAPQDSAESENEIVIESVSEPAREAAPLPLQKTSTRQSTPAEKRREGPAPEKPVQSPAARPNVATAARPVVKPSAPTPPKPTATAPKAAATSEQAPLPAPKPHSAPASKTSTRPASQGPTVPDSGLWQ